MTFCIRVLTLSIPKPRSVFLTHHLYLPHYLYLYPYSYQYIFSLIQFEVLQVKLLENQLKEKKEDNYFYTQKNESSFYFLLKKYQTKCLTPHILSADFAQFSGSGLTHLYVYSSLLDFHLIVCILSQLSTGLPVFPFDILVVQSLLWPRQVKQTHFTSSCKNFWLQKWYLSVRDSHIFIYGVIYTFKDYFKSCKTYF